MIAAVFLLALLHTIRAELPPGWKACKVSSPDYKKCLGQQVEQAIASLKSGNKKFQVSPIDPLVFKSLLIDQTNGPVSIKLELMNFAFQGLGICKVVEIKNDWKVLEAKIFHREVKTNGLYKINGKVLVLPIVGNGTCTMTWESMMTDIKLFFKEMSIKGKKYFDVSQFLVDIKPKKVKFHFDNLFNGDKALGDNMNLFLNENWEEIINELKPSITKALSAGFTRVANQVFSKIPKNELFVK